MYPPLVLLAVLRNPLDDVSCGVAIALGDEPAVVFRGRLILAGDLVGNLFCKLLPSQIPSISRPQRHLQLSPITTQLPNQLVILAQRPNPTLNVLQNHLLAVVGLRHEARGCSRRGGFGGRLIKVGGVVSRVARSFGSIGSDFRQWLATRSEVDGGLRHAEIRRSCSGCMAEEQDG